MNNLKALIITVLYLSCSSLFSQIPPPPEYEWKVNYKETTQTYYSVGKNSVLTNLDKGRLKATREVSNIEKYYRPKSNMPLTIIQKDPSRSNYKDYMIKPSTFVIDDHGISAYGSKGELLKTINHTDKYNELTKFKSSRPFLSFPTMTEKDLQEYRGTNEHISIDRDGTVTASSTSGTLIYNPTKLVKVVIRNDENGDPESTNITQYIPIISIYPDYPNSDDVLPIFVREIVKEDLPSGACAEFVKIKIYDDYTIDGGDQVQLRKSSNTNELSDQTLVYPNPVRDIVNIIGFGDQDYEVNIYSIDGTLLLTEKHRGLAKIDVADYQNGIYIICMTSNGAETIRKFIKQ